MKINDDLLDHLSKLSRLKFASEEREQIRRDLSEMLAFVEKLNEVDTGQVEPLIFVNEQFNVLRPDNVSPSLTPEEALTNAPDRLGNFFRVPKVLKKD